MSINKYCRTKSGFAGLRNVNAENGGGKDDNQESFIFAEVLKYVYLAHSDGKLLSIISKTTF